MKRTMGINEIAQELIDDQDNGFSRAGCYALAEYLEQLCEDLGEELEFDRVGIRCEYSEYENLEELAAQYTVYGLDDIDDTEEREDFIREWAQDNTTLIEFDGGVIIQDF